MKILSTVSIMIIMGLVALLYDEMTLSAFNQARVKRSSHIFPKSFISSSADNEHNIGKTLQYNSSRISTLDHVSQSTDEPETSRNLKSWEDSLDGEYEEIKFLFKKRISLIFEFCLKTFKSFEKIVFVDVVYPPSRFQNVEFAIIVTFAFLFFFICTFTCFYPDDELQNILNRGLNHHHH